MEAKHSREELKNIGIAEQHVLIALLSVGACALVLWLAPQTRVIVAFPLIVGGRMLETLGRSVVANEAEASSAPQALGVTPENDGDSIAWLLGLGVLSAPILFARFSFIQGWLNGANQTCREWQEQLQRVR